MSCKRFEKGEGYTAAAAAPWWGSEGFLEKQRSGFALGQENQKINAKGGIAEGKGKQQKES